MPELPEVESLRRSLEPVIVGRRIEDVIVVRSDVCEFYNSATTIPEMLLNGCEIRSLNRRGKQLAIQSSSGGIMCFGLGMTGAIEIRDRDDPLLPHTHVRWYFDDGQRMDFIDPRRFGGISTYVDDTQLIELRWSRLGADALEANVEDIRSIVRESRRAVKSVLLDQAVIAGVGNIYADESLFRSGVDPRKKAHRIDLSTWGRIVENVRSVLMEAIDSGGSTIRDYRRSDGSPGRAQERHAVYGRGGGPCVRCGAVLRIGQIAQRTTVWCPQCQRR